MEQTRKHQMEILAPAGDFEMLRAAVYSGADCVYLGVEGFNARRGAVGFSGELLQQAVAFCHARGCGVYAALNTIVLPGEEKQLQKAVCAVAEAGCDAVILQDHGAAALAKAAAPGLMRHASTQMSIHSAAGVRAMAKMGFSRVILAREMSLADIKEAALAAKECGVELEVFVHGALCVCVSGECYMSAFLGGRSANRGACAGPCRLPFSAGKMPKDAENYHLSLKDLSVLDRLPHLAEAGVASAKIEGRLRGPEYCATVVDAANSVLCGQPYDKKQLAAVFSRSGFTDGWLTGRGGADMFGTRRGEDTAAAKAALPKARELYRRERARVPVEFSLLLQPQGGRLCVTDGVYTVEGKLEGPLETAQTPMEATLVKALGKTGGTPFYPAKTEVQANGLFVSAGAVNAVRRQLLAELLAKRSALPPQKTTNKVGFADILYTEKSCEPPLNPGAEKPLLCARFSGVGQVPAGAEKICHEIILPIAQAGEIPPALRAKTRLALPRVLFGSREQAVARLVEKTKEAGFKGYEIQNPAHWVLCEGCSLSSGFGLNVANAGTVIELARQGVCRQILSPELTLAQMRRIAKDAAHSGVQLDALAYGHLPLMVTRVCPVHNSTDCAGCAGGGLLTDRKGAGFLVTCEDGVRNIHNPVALWMGDRLDEIPVDSVTLYFTSETQQQAGQVLEAFLKRKPAPKNFTRGLYDRGVL